MKDQSITGNSSLGRVVDEYIVLKNIKLLSRNKLLVKGGMVFNATFNSILVILLALLMEETGVPGENHRQAACHWQTLSHNFVSSTHRLSDNL